MKIWHLADIHFGAIHKETIDNFIKVADSLESPSVIVVAGDLFHTSLYFDDPDINQAIDFLMYLNDKVNRSGYVIVSQGTLSHDRNTLSILKNIFDKFTNKIHIFTELSEYKNFAICPEPTLNTINDTINFLQNTTKPYVVFHGSVEGAQLHSSKTVEQCSGMRYLSKGLFKKFKLGLLGHIHKPQQVSGLNAYYSGSLGRWKFGEEEDKGFYIHDTEKITKPQFMSIKSPLYKTVKFDKSSEAEKFIENLEINDPIRIILNEELSKQVEIPPNVTLKVDKDYKSVMSNKALAELSQTSDSLSSKIKTYIEERLNYAVDSEFVKLIDSILDEVDVDS